jgi:hypothetical protein
MLCIAFVGRSLGRQNPSGQRGGDGMQRLLGRFQRPCRAEAATYIGCVWGDGLLCFAD